MKNINFKTLLSLALFFLASLSLKAGSGSATVPHIAYYKNGSYFLSTTVYLTNITEHSIKATVNSMEMTAPSYRALSWPLTIGVILTLKLPQKNPHMSFYRVQALLPITTGKPWLNGKILQGTTVTLQLLHMQFTANRRLTVDFRKPRPPLTTEPHSSRPFP